MAIDNTQALVYLTEVAPPVAQPEGAWGSLVLDNNQ